jgi:hypothetical protein
MTDTIDNIGADAARELFRRKLTEMHVSGAHCFAMAMYGSGFDQNKPPHRHLLTMDKRSAKRKMRAIRKYYAHTAPDTDSPHGVGK